MSDRPSDPPSDRKSGLTVLGSSSGSSADTSEGDESFLGQERQISSQEFLEAVLDDRREEVAKMIIHDDRLVRSRDASGATAILLACYHGLDDILGMLLRSGAELDVFEAAAVGDVERLEALIDEDPSLLLESSGDGFPPLQLSCFFGRRPAAKEILDRVEGGGVDRADVDRAAVLGRAADNPTRVQPIHSAGACRDAETSLELVRRLLDLGADPEAEQAGGFRPLHQAASAGRLELVELLLERGADPRAESDMGRTPADFADDKGHDEIAERLRSAAG